MASVFKEGSRWSAQVRLWSAERGDWIWKKIRTGLEDKGAALGVATRLESESAAVAVAGYFTRERAMDLVNDMLRLAGLPAVSAVPMTWAFSEEVATGSGLAGKSLQKYAACRESLMSWVDQVDRPLDAWTMGDFQRYYAWLLGRFSAASAYAHLRFWRQVFNRAMKLGLLRVSPAAAVTTEASEGESKVPLTRADVAALLRHLRRSGAAAGWVTLSLLGWHTGARIQDLLGLTKESVVSEPGVGLCVAWLPAKTKKRGRRVVLPVPRYLALRLLRAGDLTDLRQGNNHDGKVSELFVALLVAAGVDVMRRKQAKSQRAVHLKSFHSFRHSMSSRLAAAGVAGGLARLVTAHASEQVHAGYVHAEVVSIAGALRAVRRK